jgi:hypothetical protein
MDHPIPHPEQDETHNTNCNCLRSDMHRRSWPDERAISWYQHDPTMLNLEATKSLTQTLQTRKACSIIPWP